MIDLYRLNLNLLVALDILLAEKSVTKAAQKLFLTQAAMSNNLQQLRVIFKDELLIREKNRMVLTSFAASLQAKLHHVLEQMRELVENGQQFAAETSNRLFKIAMSDYCSALVLPQLLEKLEQAAPGIKLTVIPADPLNSPQPFENGDCDLALGMLPFTDPAVTKQLLFQDQGVCVMNTQHACAKKPKLSLTDYLAYPHLAITRVGQSDRPKLVEEALAALNVQRNVKIGLPYMEPIFQMIAQSETLLATIPHKVAKRYQNQYHFVIKPLPFTIKPMEFYLVWHRRYDSDFGHQWLRAQIAAIFS
jgi:DNA-binding transcriptional LysR family regulator